MAQPLNLTGGEVIEPKVCKTCFFLAIRVTSRINQSGLCFQGCSTNGNSHQFRDHNMMIVGSTGLIRLLWPDDSQRFPGRESLQVFAIELQGQSLQAHQQTYHDRMAF